MMVDAHNGEKEQGGLYTELVDGLEPTTTNSWNVDVFVKVISELVCIFFWYASNYTVVSKCKLGKRH